MCPENNILWWKRRIKWAKRRNKLRGAVCYVFGHRWGAWAYHYEPLKWMFASLPGDIGGGHRCLRCHKWEPAPEPVIQFPGEAHTQPEGEK